MNVTIASAPGTLPMVSGRCGRASLCEGSAGDRWIGDDACVGVDDDRLCRWPYSFLIYDLGGGGVPPIPEPETYALMLAGLGVMGFIGKWPHKT